MEYFMDDEYKAISVSNSAAFSMGYTPIKANDSDIKSNVLGQLIELKKRLNVALSSYKYDDVSKYHLLECKRRVEEILSNTK
jgi:hypothetical protein